MRSKHPARGHNTSAQPWIHPRISALRYWIVNGHSSPPAVPVSLWLTADLSRIKIGPGEHVLQVDVAVRLLLLQHDHRVGLPQEWPGGAQFPQLYQLEDDLQAVHRVSAAAQMNGAHRITGTWGTSTHRITGTHDNGAHRITGHT